MNRPVFGDLMDEAWKEFRKGTWYLNSVKPHLDRCGMSENLARRIFDDAFMLGRVSKRNHPLTSGEKVLLQNNFYQSTRKKFKK